MPVSDDVEQEARRLHQAGRHREAMTLAVEHYGPELVGLLASLVDHDEAFDVFGQACLAMWKGFPSFGWRCSFRTWAYTVVRRSYLNHADDAYRRQRVRLSDAPHISALHARIRTQTRPYLRTDVKSRAARLREQLSSDERMLLTLRVDRAMSWEDVARVLHADEGGLDGTSLQRAAASWRKRFERTKDHLRTLAEREGLLEDSA